MALALVQGSKSQFGGPRSGGTRLLRQLGAAALLLVAAACGSDGSKTCHNGKATDLGSGDHLCYCESSDTCSQTCPVGMAGCAIVCAGTSSCTLTAPGSGCSAQEVGALLNAHCGEKATIDCSDSLGTCAAVVGADSEVLCMGAIDCQIECQGKCDVQCGRDGVCRVACDDPAHCSVACDTPANSCSNASGSIRGCNTTC